MADELPRNVLHYIFPEPADYERVYDEEHPKDDFDYEEDDEGGNCLSWPIFLAGAALWIAILGLIWLAILVTGAHAHEAPTGWRYPMSCCWSPETAPAGRPGDCDQIPAKSAKAISGGYSVTLVPGDHPMVRERITVLVPYPQAKDSPDNEFHICFTQDMKVRCFWAPPPGV